MRQQMLKQQYTSLVKTYGWNMSINSCPKSADTTADLYAFIGTVERLGIGGRLRCNDVIQWQ